MDTILSLQQNYKRSTLIRYGFGAFAGLSFLAAIYSKVQERLAYKEIAYRKKQLAKQVYVLQGDQLVNFPWNKNNINDWLFRKVQIRGRPLIYRGCMIPNKSVQLDGFEEVVPLVTKQNKVEQEGIMLSRGFVPAKYKDPNDRVRIEDVTKQTYVGFVSKLQDLPDAGMFSGNTSAHGKHSFTHANLLDFADASKFVNRQQMSVAIIEELDTNGPIDERNPQRRAHDCQYAVPYPYKKTYSGALQLKKMPWEYSNEANLWFGLSLLGMIKFLI